MITSAAHRPSLPDRRWTRRAHLAALAPMLLGLILFTPGCLFVMVDGEFGPNLDEAPIDQVEIGRSTKGDVLRLLGPPQEFLRSEILDSVLDEQTRITGALQVGNRAYDAFTYQFDRLRGRGTYIVVFGLIDAAVESDLLMILFDENEVVREVSVRRRGENG